MWSLLWLIEGIVIVAVTIHVVYVNFVDVLLELDFEESTASRIRVYLASIVKVWLDLGVDKITVHHIGHFTRL